MNREGMNWVPQPYQEVEDKKDHIESVETLPHTISKLVIDKLASETVLKNYGGEKMKVEIQYSFNDGAVYEIEAVGDDSEISNQIEVAVKKSIDEKLFQGQVKLSHLSIRRGVYDENSADKQYKDDGYIGYTRII